jgi:hypothetical protein
MVNSYVDIPDFNPSIYLIFALPFMLNVGQGKIGIYFN